MTVENILEFIRKMTQNKRDWPPQSQRYLPSWQTVQDISGASSCEDHEERIKNWGKSVLYAYHDCFDDLERFITLLCKEKN